MSRTGSPAKARGTTPRTRPPVASLAERAVDRRVGQQTAAARDDVRRLLDVGLELVRTSPDGTLPKVTDIVAAAGSSNDAFYRLFKSRDLFLAAIVDDGVRRLVGYLEHQAAKARTPQGKVRAVIAGLLAQAGDARVADATRAVMRCTPSRRLTDALQQADLNTSLGDLLTPALAELGSTTPARDARTIVQASFATMEADLWAYRTPSRADLTYLVRLASRLSGAR